MLPVTFQPFNPFSPIMCPSLSQEVELLDLLAANPSLSSNAAIFVGEWWVGGVLTKEKRRQLRACLPACAHACFLTFLPASLPAHLQDSACGCHPGMRPAPLMASQVWQAGMVVGTFLPTLAEASPLWQHVAPACRPAAMQESHGGVW